jgi:flagellar basal body-associated protein FliL
MSEPEPNSVQDESAQAAGAPPKRRSRKLVLFGGSAGLIVLVAWVLSLVAVPGKAHDEQHLLLGPFVVDISPRTGFQVNLAGRGGRHYLALSIKAEVDAFEQAYALALAEAPLYQARVTDTVLDLAARKAKDELEDEGGKELLREELRVALDPVLFAVHVGQTEHVDQRDLTSGLRPGLSNRQATMRGMFYEHELEIDATAHTVKLDDGPAVTFEGGEADLMVQDAAGRSVYLDLSGLEEGFKGKVHVGVMGRVRSINFSQFLTQ